MTFSDTLSTISFRIFHNVKKYFISDNQTAMGLTPPAFLQYLFHPVGSQKQ